MKSTIILAALLTLVSCGKKADFDGRKTTPNPVGNAPVTIDPLYKETVTLTASVTYASKLRTGGMSNNLSVVNESFKVPQEITVTQGWASVNTTAKITMSAIGLNDVSCFYRSKATVSHNNTSNSNTEYTNGMTYAFSHCEDTSIDPTVVVESFDKVSLVVVSADDLETTTAVKADIKIYQ